LRADRYKIPAAFAARAKSPITQLGGSTLSKKASPFQLQYASFQIAGQSSTA
jgi:hypothetical protein